MLQTIRLRISSPHSVTVVQGGPSLRSEFLHLRSPRWWFLLLGVLLVLCGTVAIVVPPIATLAAIDVLAILFLIGGVATVVQLVLGRPVERRHVHVLIGVLYIAIGLAMTEKASRGDCGADDVHRGALHGGRGIPHLRCPVSPSSAMGVGILLQ